MADFDPNFPCSLYENLLAPLLRLIDGCLRAIDLPLPTNRLASSALRALQVDAELSPLVHRTLKLTSSHSASSKGVQQRPVVDGDETVLRIEYKATTNRMLRVAVNGFFESVGVVLGVMEELDVDVLTPVE